VSPGADVSRVATAAGAAPDVSVVIPTYRRGQVLIETLEHVLALQPPAREVLVVDQTEQVPAPIAARLREWSARGVLRWLRLRPPSIPAAMNRGLLEARGEVVLFLDDDVVPAPDLARAHASAYAETGVWAVVGQVLQPGETPGPAPAPGRGRGAWRDLGFRFSAGGRAFLASGIACNLSVLRARALAAGGFDENFVGVAYRFETEFCRRLARHGGCVLFDPRAKIRHLRAPSGGTRALGDPLRSARPEHSVGEYYFALRECRWFELPAFVGWRMARAVHSRFHLRRPWWIPVKLLGEVRGLAWAAALHRRGPSLLAADGAGRRGRAA